MPGAVLHFGNDVQDACSVFRKDDRCIYAFRGNGNISVVGAHILVDPEDGFQFITVGVFGLYLQPDLFARFGGQPVAGHRNHCGRVIGVFVVGHTPVGPTGKILLIPQGTRVIGQYDNGVGFGQRRVLIVWNRLIFPNGRSIVLERQSGADTQGYAGLEDGVDYHWWDIAKAAALSTLLGVGAELAADDNDRLISAIRGGAQDTINDAGQQIVRRQLNVAPTLTIRPGFPVRVVVTRDLVLEPYGG